MKTALTLVGLVLVTACKASVSAEAKTGSGDDEEVADFDKPLEQPASASSSEPPEASEGQALLGARHDLAYKGPATAKCECLVAALGNPNDPAFEWATAPPPADANQLVIAISTGGNACPSAPKDALGPSYWGYRIQGNDVIVIVESAILGRPITTGAIIPKPAGDGQVYVRPADRNVPYGRGLDKTQQCKIGNPGPPRTAPPPPATPPNQAIQSTPRDDGTTTSEVPPIQ